MDLGGLLRILSRRQALALGAVGVVLASTAGLVILHDDDHDVAVQTADDPTTTTSEATTTTTTEPTTTTTVATTTTTTAPPVTAPPTTAAPPPPPPPPPTSGAIDMAALIALAESGNGVAPKTYTGGNLCPIPVEKNPSDTGDDTVRDIGTNWSLVRYCDDVYRLSMDTLDETALSSFWLEADTGPGGCGGIDRVAIAWDRDWNRRGAVVATPTCDPGTWTYLDAAGAPIWNGYFLQLDFRGSALGHPATFTWRAAVQGVGETGAAIDVVPNGGRATFTI
jgi:hypothetical protein